MSAKASVGGRPPVLMRYEEQDPDALAEIISRQFTPVRFEPRNVHDRIGISGVAGGFGGVYFGHMRFAGDLTIFPQRPHDCVTFVFPEHGRLLFRQANDVLVGTSTIGLAGEGSICQSVVVAEGHRQCGLTVARPVLAERLSILLGRPMQKKVVFEPLVNLDAHRRLHGLRALVEFATGAEFGDELNTGTSSPQRLQEMLVDLVLEVWPHTHWDAFHRPSAMISPRHVKLAIDYIHDHPEICASGTELAALTGVSLRALQAGFKRFAGMSIVAYQRQVRLEQAHNDLSRNPSLSVTEVALRWGFVNVGRFSRYFQNAYGISPAVLRHRSKL